MADLSKFETNPKLQLLEEIKEARCVMLGSPDRDEHMQPMAPQIDQEIIDAARDGAASVMYFFSDRTSDLGKAVLDQPGTRVMATHIGSDYQACIEGVLNPVEADPILIDRFWNPIAASWYPDGKQDLKLLMLRFDPITAGVWASTGNPLKIAYETIKANINDTEPSLGASKVIAA